MTDQRAPLATVVGAGPGLGLSIARRFDREGFRVALLSLGPDPMDTPGLDAVQEFADIADPVGLRAALDRLRAAAGDPEVLVFNASEYVEGTPTQVDHDAVVHGLRVGVLGALVALQQVAPAMRAAGRGTVLVTGSEAAIRPFPPACGLGMQKAAVRNLVLAAAQELAPQGVHVATVTIRGVLKRGTAFDPDLIAEHYWQLHAETAGPEQAWRTEVEHVGA